MNRLESLELERNRLLELYQKKDFESGAKILVNIMDIEEDIAEEVKALECKDKKPLVV